jgi:hypothetical protein
MSGQSVIARIHGGLGNQMFQYACARAICLRTGFDLILDTRRYERKSDFPFGLAHFKTSGQSGSARNLPPDKSQAVRYAIWRALKRPPRFVRERGLGFNDAVPGLDMPVYLHGYWQSQRYFDDQLASIRKDFEFAAPPDSENAAWLSKVETARSVSVHLRRGDYVKDPRINAAHGTCSVDYYQRAIRAIAEKANIEPDIYVFSDDPAWASDNLAFPFPTSVIGHNGAARNFEDLRLMSACAHHVIANSSFSWWGAWLNSSPAKLVIAPKRWYARADLSNPDICPPDWIRISA